MARHIYGQFYQPIRRPPVRSAEVTAFLGVVTALRRKAEAAANSAEELEYLRLAESLERIAFGMEK